MESFDLSNVFDNTHNTVNSINLAECFNILTNCFADEEFIHEFTNSLKVFDDNDICNYLETVFGKHPMYVAFW